MSPRHDRQSPKFHFHSHSIQHLRRGGLYVLLFFFIPCIAMTQRRVFESWLISQYGSSTCNALSMLIRLQNHIHGFSLKQERHGGSTCFPDICLRVPIPFRLVLPCPVIPIPETHLFFFLFALIYTSASRWGLDIGPRGGLSFLNLPSL